MKSLLAAVALTAAMMTHAWAQQNRCMPLGAFLQMVGERWGEQVMWVSTDERKSYLVTRNPEPGSWTLAEHGRGMACPLATGSVSVVEPSREPAVGDPA